jgi:hypothetical protein
MTIENRHANLKANTKIRRGIEQLERGEGIPEDRLDDYLARLKSNRRLADVAAQVDAYEGIRQGQEDVKKGRVRPARQALESFRRKH